MYPRACGLVNKYGHSDMKQCHILVHVFLRASVCQPPLVLEQTCLANEVWQDQGQGKIVALESKAEQNHQGNLLWAVTWSYSRLIWTNSAWKKSSKYISLKGADLLFMLNRTQCYKSVEVTLGGLTVLYVWGIKEWFDEKLFWFGLSAFKNWKLEYHCWHNST